MSELEQFILEHQDSDAASLLLKSIQWPALTTPTGVQLEDSATKNILANTIDGRKKIKAKVAQWYSIPGLLYPTRLCTEQCSSSATAKIKADLLQGIISSCTSKTIADLTSGLGIDVWAFSGICDKVLYNDMDPLLVYGARHNFATLSISNVDYSNVKVEPGNLGSILTGFWSSPGVIFLDPARRDSAGKKVFLLEDCQPDVLSLMPELLEHSSNIVLKLSPMADITMVCQRLSKANAPVREVHVVSSGAECKELLIWIDSRKENDGNYKLIVHESEKSFSCDNMTEESSSSLLFSSKEDLFQGVNKYLFEPGKSITKAGLFNQISQRFSITKAGKSSHLYFCSQGSLPELEGLGKLFKIIEILPFGGKTFKEISSKYKEAEVTSRNLPISSDELRKKLKVKSSQKIHIFAFKADFSSEKSEQVIIISERL